MLRPATCRALRRSAAHLAARQQQRRTAAAAGDAAPDSLTITRPDDWHLHVRDGTGLASVVPHSAATFGRAVIMPNLQPPVTTVAQVRQTIQMREQHCPSAGSALLCHDKCS